MRKTAHGWGCATALCVALGGAGCVVTVDEDDAHERVPASHAHALTRGDGEVTPITSAATPPPTLDGARDPQYETARVHALSRLLRGTQPAVGRHDAVFRALHGPDALYLFVEVHDQAVVTDSPAATPWEDDAIEVFIDGDGKGGAQYDGRNDVQLIVRPGDPAVHLGLRSAKVDVRALGVVTRRTPDGYRAELVVPWRAVGTRWRRDATLGLDVHVNDDDDGGTRERKIAWSAHEDEAWQRPSLFARVRLEGKGREAQVRAVGDAASEVTGMSHGGDVLVGAVASAAGQPTPEAFRWTPGGGLTRLGLAASRALAVSPNGERIAGLAAQPDDDRASGTWTAGGSFVRLRGPLSNGVEVVRIAEPTVVLDDGRVFGICRQYGVPYPIGACRQDGPAQITMLHPASVIYAADAAGHTAGVRLPSRGEPIGAVPVLDGVELPFPTTHGCILPHACRAELRAFSAGAAVVVGAAEVPVAVPAGETPPAAPLHRAAFSYTRERGMETLPDLPGGDDAAGAYAVSRDGRLIAGFGHDATGWHAVVWRDRVAARLIDLIRATGTAFPDDWTLRTVRAMTPDGRTYAVDAERTDGLHKAYWVQFPEAR